MYNIVKRCVIDAQEGFARKPGALAKSRLEGWQGWEEIRRVELRRVGAGAGGAGVEKGDHNEHQLEKVFSLSPEGLSRGFRWFLGVPRVGGARLKKT